MSESKYDEEFLEDAPEEEYSDEDYDEGDLAEEESLEEEAEGELADFIIAPEFIPDTEELRTVVETWNKRNEGKVINFANAHEIYETKLLINRTRRRVRFFRRTFKFGYFVVFAGAVLAVLREYVLEDAGIPLAAVIGTIAFGVFLIVLGKLVRKHFRQKVKEGRATLSEKKEVFYEEQRSVFALEDEAKEYFIANGIKCSNRRVPEVLVVLMQRCGLDIPIVEIPRRPPRKSLQGSALQSNIVSGNNVQNTGVAS